MEKDQLSKQNKQLTFDLEKARETIQTKNKDNLKVRTSQEIPTSYCCGTCNLT